MIDYRDDNKWTVYIHIVPKELSGYDWDKYYVGITSRKVERRWGKNGSRYDDRHPYFRNAIKKYGWDNIQHNIVCENLTYNEAIDMEKLLIKKLKSNDKIHGYNMTKGGEGTAGLTSRSKGKHLSEETKQKISNTLKGRYIDEVWKQHIGKAVKKRWEDGGDLRIRMSGENSPNYGKPGYFKDKKGFDNPTSKPIICLNTLKVYGSSSLASEDVGNADYSSICACCRGDKHAIGTDDEKIPLVWMWYNDYKEKSKQEVNEYLWDRLSKTKYKPVINIDTMELFSTTKIASLHYGNNDSSNFIRHLKSDKKIYGHNWEYYVDYLKQNNLTPLEIRENLFFVA